MTNVGHTKGGRTDHDHEPLKAPEMALPRGHLVTF
jgi:hypothetical protein